MEFYENHGPGARTFFTALSESGLSDSYAIGYDRDCYVYGEPLASSHIIRSSEKRFRYDFVFIRQDKIAFESCRYDYEETSVSADHALIKVNVD